MSINLSSSEGIAFYWWGSGGSDQNIDFEMWSPTGGWVGTFPDGPARWRWVFLRWSDLTAVDFDGSRPDRSNITGIFWTYHTDGVRRINYIVGWRKQDVYCHAIIKQPTSVDLYAHVEFIRSIELYGHAEIRHPGVPAELLARFEVGQGSADLLCKFEVAQDWADLLVKFNVVIGQFQVSIREHKDNASWNPDWVFSKSSGSIIRGTSTLASLGAGLFFFNVKRDWIHGKYIRITWRFSGWSTWGNTVRVYDGAYNRASLVDFPQGAGILLKGNGLLQTGLSHAGPFGPITEEFQVDASGGSEDMVMILIRSRDSWTGQQGLVDVDTVEINAGPGGVDVLYRESFDSAINMENTGTTYDYGYISEGGFPPAAAAGSAGLFAKFVVNP